MSNHPTKPTANGSKARRQKKRLMWMIRWGIVLGLYVTFWNAYWVKWTLMITVPIGLFCLHLVLFGAEEKPPHSPS